MDELRRLREENPETYRTIELDLSVARENEVIKFEGNTIGPLLVEGNVTIRLNNPSNSPISLEHMTYLQSPFYEIYVSNPAQPAKKATFVLGSYSQFDLHGIGAARAIGRARQVSDATRIVAASNSHSDSQAAAHYVCDGSDDQIEIQRAIDDLPLVGGKVLLMEGNYHVSQPIILRSNLCLEGFGGSTKLRLKDGSITGTGMANAIPILTYNMHGTLPDRIYNVHIKDLYLDGNLANQIADAWSENLRIHTTDHFVIENVVSVNGRSGIVTEKCNQGFISNNIVKNGSVDGIEVDECHFINVSGNYLLDCNEGIDIFRSRNCNVNNNIINFINRHPDHGIRLTNMSYSVFDNNIIINNSPYFKGEGIGCESRDTPRNPWELNQNNIISNNIIFNFLYSIRFRLRNPNRILTNFIIINNKFLNCQNHTFTNPETHWIRYNQGIPTENSGTATFSGDGITTTFTIPHGLIMIPKNVSILAKSADAASDKFWSADATNITVTFTTAPITGTNNVVLSWEAKIW